MTTLSQTTINQIISEFVEDNIHISACEPITFRDADTTKWDWHLIVDDGEGPTRIDLNDYFFDFAHECYGDHYEATEEGVLLHNLHEENQIELRPVDRPYRVGLGPMSLLATDTLDTLNEMVDESDYVRENGLMPCDIEFVLADNGVLYAFFADANQ